MVDGERLQPLLKELRIFTKSRPKSEPLPTRVDFVSLSKDQLTEFQERGVVIARGILDYDDLQPVIDEIAEFIDVRGLELKAAGKIDDLKKEESFERRFGLLCKQSTEISHGMDIMHRRGPAMFSFLSNDHLLQALESIIGPEITCSPIQHIRPKPPANENGQGADSFNVVPWHQDAGVMMEEAENTNIVTCWLPLGDSTKEMGCLQVLPGINKVGYLKHHAAHGTTVVPGQIVEEKAIDLECERGDVIFMHRFIPHRSMPNRSDQCRWSIDLRYQTTGQHTGRTGHPAFIVRSVSNPASVQSDYDTWCEDWLDALDNPKGFIGHRRDV